MSFFSQGQRQGGGVFASSISAEIRQASTKTGGNEEGPLYAREALRTHSDLSQYVTHDVSDKPYTPTTP